MAVGSTRTRVRRALARRTLVVLPLITAPALAATFNVAGPPPARTGGFGEQTCHECHFDGPLNESGGGVAIAGAPSAYEPGRTYTLQVRVRHAALRRAGFQLSARYAAGPDRGRQAGELGVSPAAGATTAENDVVYAHHIANGTVPDAPGEHRWAIDWTAPADARADVILHVAANAANDDDSEFGDRIYTADIVVPLRTK